ncbi:MAG: Lsr2 family protein [Nocardioides sp.]|jgi:hypothetical protein
MAQRVNIIFVDDIDGSEGAENITFGLDGVTYEIDLSEANASRLREALAPYVGAARKVSRAAGGRARRTTTAGTGPNPRQVRDWARSNGIEVSDRGRVSADVIAAFEAAN